jgi:N-acetylmuramoyl-L-alanine amidase
MPYWRGRGILKRLGVVAGAAALLSAVASDAAVARDPLRTGTFAGQPAQITNAYVETVGDLTCFQIASIGRLSAQVYQVKNPDRVVIDVPQTKFRLARELKRVSGGAVKTFRYGQQDSNHGRIVIDVAKDTQVLTINHHDLGGNRHQLYVALNRGTEPSLAICGGLRRWEDEPAAKIGDRSLVVPSERKARPVVVIDPGHGGVDPGAVVNEVYLEKHIVLAVARRVLKRLQAKKGLDVVMTRTKDKFVTLNGRIERTRASKGDLFISLHADSVENAVHLPGATGAAVYTLSHRASNAEAKKLAEKENAADLLGGILSKATLEKEGVRNILVDLLKRETESESTRLSKLLIGAMRGKLVVSKDPYRSAAFRVLKQTETPAVLIELGYMTNPRDLRLMRQAEWQERMANAISKAVLQFIREK